MRKLGSLACLERFGLCKYSSAMTVYNPVFAAAQKALKGGVKAKGSPKTWWSNLKPENRAGILGGLGLGGAGAGLGVVSGYGDEEVPDDEKGKSALIRAALLGLPLGVVGYKGSKGHRKFMGDALQEPIDSVHSMIDNAQPFIRTNDPFQGEVIQGRQEALNIAKAADPERLIHGRGYRDAPTSKKLKDITLRDRELMSRAIFRDFAEDSPEFVAQSMMEGQIRRGLQAVGSQTVSGDVDALIDALRAEFPGASDKVLAGKLHPDKLKPGSGDPELLSRAYTKLVSSRGAQSTGGDAFERAMFEHGRKLAPGRQAFKDYASKLQNKTFIGPTDLIHFDDRVKKMR